jgi:hypothetical protein
MIDSTLFTVIWRHIYSEDFLCFLLLIDGPSWTQLAKESFNSTSLIIAALDDGKSRVMYC